VWLIALVPASFPGATLFSLLRVPGKLRSGSSWMLLRLQDPFRRHRVAGRGSSRRVGPPSCSSRKPT
jgi:hypothetical protein